MKRIRVLAILLGCLLLTLIVTRAVFGIAGPPPGWGFMEPAPAMETVHAAGGESDTAVLLFHGCAGDFDPNHQREWAETLSAAGYDAVIVNSLRPRAIAPKSARRMVCPGYWLWGNRRAHDVAKAVDAAAPGYRRIVLIGFSHGAWSTMEYFDRFPVHSKIDRVVWFYPYCGFGATHGQRMPSSVQALVIPARDDRLVDHDRCRADMKNLSIDERELPGRHGFDIRDDPRVWNAQSAAKAQALVLDALRERAPAAP